MAARRTRVLGPAHPDTLLSRLGLAGARADSGDVAGAVSVLAGALDDAEQSVGPLHPLTVLVRAQLAQGHAAMGMTDAAVTGLGRAAADSETLFGANHPETAALRADLALLTREQGPADEIAVPRPRTRMVGDPASDEGTRTGGRITLGRPGVEGTTPG